MASFAPFRRALQAALPRHRSRRSALITLLAVGGCLVPSPAHADPVRDEQWQLRTLNATAAWRYATGAGVTVAVIDSGVDASHADLRGQVLPGIDLVDGSTDGQTDLVGHGTAVAALIAGSDDDDAGAIGLAPRAKILPVRVLDGANRYDDATVVANGVRWAVDHGASVVNLSLGGATRSEALAEAIEYATANDVVVVACTGNQDGPATTGSTTSGTTASGATTSGTTTSGTTTSGTTASGATSSGSASSATSANGTPTTGTTPDGNATEGSATASGPATVWYPAREPGVVAVAGLARPPNRGTGAGRDIGLGRTGDLGRDVGGERDAESLWGGSLSGPETVLTAPGAGILAAKPGGYRRVQGTSFAAPLVSATAALIRSRWPALDAANVINRLVRSAHDLGPAGRDDQFGFGEVDPVAALTASIPTVSSNPLRSQTASLDEASRTATPTVTGSRLTERGAHATAAGRSTFDEDRFTILGSTAVVLLLTITVGALRRFPV